MGGLTIINPSLLYTLDHFSNSTHRITGGLLVFHYFKMVIHVYKYDNIITVTTTVVNSQLSNPGAGEVCMYCK